MQPHNIIVILLVSLIFAGCTQIQKAENPLIGNWIMNGPFGVSAIITFRSADTMIINSNIFGAQAYHYKILDGDTMALTALDTGEQTTTPFKVLGNYDALLVGKLTYIPYTEQK